MLEDGEEAVRLAAHRHGQGQMLHTVGDVPGGEQLLAQLDLDTRRSALHAAAAASYLLQEEPLHGLLVAEVRQLGTAAIPAPAVGGLALLSQLPPEVGVTSSFSDILSHII